MNILGRGLPIKEYVLISRPGLLRKGRAFFHHFGTMTHTPGIGNFSMKMPKMGNFLELLAVLSNQKFIIYLSEFSCRVNLQSPLHDVLYETMQC